MAVFASSDDLYKVFAPYFEKLAADPQIGPKFVSANTAFRVNYSEPEASFALDARQDPPRVLSGDEAAAHDVEVELAMSADEGHRFWLGKVNMPVALARRKVVVTGPIAKLLGILPALQPAFAIYRDHLAEVGHGEPA
ncbi:MULTISPECIES: hypothetical protein [unclassified Pseudonocardia]|uniref:hypothetical protein n=1 Tax=unclassified Pseudonocardia TaxID=2619320 RepID=UPI00094AA868|nr:MULTISPECIES: hypothetical protein [unclassified Pseudonocardia]